MYLFRWSKEKAKHCQSVNSFVLVHSVSLSKAIAFLVNVQLLQAAETFCKVMHFISSSSTDIRFCSQRIIDQAQRREAMQPDVKFYLFVNSFGSRDTIFAPHFLLFLSATKSICPFIITPRYCWSFSVSFKLLPTFRLSWCSITRAKCRSWRTVFVSGGFGGITPPVRWWSSPWLGVVSSGTFWFSDNGLVSTPRRRFFFHILPMVLACTYPVVFYLCAIVVNTCENQWDYQTGECSQCLWTPTHSSRKLLLVIRSFAYNLAI